MANVETLGTLERRVSMTRAGGGHREAGRRAPEEDRARRAHAGLPPGQGADEAGGADLRAAGAQRGAGRRGAEDRSATWCREANLKVAGYPKIEKKDEPNEKALEFSATFEIYPEVKVGDLAAATIERPKVAVDDADGRQDHRDPAQAAHALRRRCARGARRRPPDGRLRRHASTASRSTAAAPRTSVRAGRGPHAARVRGRGARHVAGREQDLRAQVSRRLPRQGRWPGRKRRSPMTLKKRRGAAAAGARRRVRQGARRRRRRPRQDAQRGARQRRARGEEARRRAAQAAGAAGAARRDAARAAEVAGRAWSRSSWLERAVADLQARGLKPEQLPALNLQPSAFAETAKRRVALGLIIGELARSESLQPKPAEVRAMVEQEAQTYESPAEVVKWFYMQPQRLSEMEGAGPGSQCREVGLVESQGCRQGSCVRRADGGRPVNWERGRRSLQLRTSRASA